jgi:cell division protein FtsB
MVYTQESRLRSSERVWIALLFVIGIAALGVALFGGQGLREVRRLRVERQRMAAEIEQLRAQRSALEKEIASLRDNPRAVEEKARDELGMIREGETVFLLPERHEPAR